MKRDGRLDLLRLFAACMVVLVHSDNIFQEYAAVMPVFIIPFSALANTGNVIFMAVSGWLLGRKGDPYIVNLRKKLRSVFIPLILWDFIWIIAEAAGHAVMPYRFENIAGWGITEWITGLTGIPFIREPFYFPFWFMSCLMFMNLVSPAVMYCAQKIPYAFTAALAVLWFLPVNVYVRISVVFFSLGCVLAKQEKMRNALSRIPGYAAGLAALAAAGLVLWRYDALTTKISVMLYLPGVFRLCSALIRKPVFERLTEKYIPYLIFIYAVHAKVLVVLQTVWTRVISYSVPAAAAGYIVLPAAAVFISIAAGMILKRIAPGIAGLLSGGR